MLYATQGWLTAGRPKAHPRALPSIGSIMVDHIGLIEPSPASSQWLAPDPAPNVQSDQFGGGVVGVLGRGWEARCLAVGQVPGMRKESPVVSRAPVMGRAAPASGTAGQGGLGREGGQ